MSDGAVLSSNIIPRVYPNPTNQPLYVVSDYFSLHGARFVLFNMLGQMVKTFTCSGDNAVLDLHEVPNGQYVLQIHHPSGKSSHRVSVFH